MKQKIGIGFNQPRQTTAIGSELAFEYQAIGLLTRRAPNGIQNIC